MLLKNLMKTDIVTCTDDVTIREVAKMLASRSVGCLLITEHNILKGIVTKSDIVSSLAERKDPDYCKVNEIMNRDVKSCCPDTNIFSAAKILSANKVKRLPILSEGKLEGIVPISDLAPSLSKEIEEISCYFWKK